MRAAADTGCSWVSVSPLDVLHAEESGSSAERIGARARALGLGLVLDPVLNWSPGDPAPESRFSRVSATEGMRMARDLGATIVSAIAPRHGTAELAELVEPFAALCDQAAQFDARVQLEFIPMTLVPDVESAWEIVRSADRDNGGLVFDTWHYFRGNPDPQALARVPGTRIFSIQVNDAPAEPAEDLWAETRQRLLPGDGAFDLPALFRQLADMGALACVGPEVISTAMTDLARRDPTDAARVAMSAVRALVDDALRGGEAS